MGAVPSKYILGLIVIFAGSYRELRQDENIITVKMIPVKTNGLQNKNFAQDFIIFTIIIRFEWFIYIVQKRFMGLSILISIKIEKLK